MNSVINPLNPLGSTTIQKYLDQGEEKGKKAVAVKMLKRGRPLDEIIEDTDFSEKIIREIANENGLQVNKS